MAGAESGAYRVRSAHTVRSARLPDETSDVVGVVPASCGGSDGIRGGGGGRGGGASTGDGGTGCADAGGAGIWNIELSVCGAAVCALRTVGVGGGIDAVRVGLLPPADDARGSLVRCRGSADRSGWSDGRSVRGGGSVAYEGWRERGERGRSGERGYRGGPRSYESSGRRVR